MRLAGLAGEEALRFLLREELRVAPSLMPLWCVVRVLF